MIVTIKTRTVGQNFGTAGIAVARGVVVYESRTFPLGFTAAAIESVLAWAEKNGHEVRS